MGHIDITPTILDMLDMKIPEVIQGKSLLPLIDNPTKWKEEDCYFESLAPNLNRNWAPLQGFIRVNRKYISIPIPELYDMEKDFTEQENLADKENPVVRDLKADLVAFQRGEATNAVKLFEEILVKRPDYGVIYDNLAHVYRENGELDRSIELLEKAAELNVADASLMSKLAIYYQEAGQLEKAKTLLEGLAQSDPNDVEILNYLGVTNWTKPSMILCIISALPWPDRISSKRRSHTWNNSSSLPLHKNTPQISKT